MTAGKFEYPKRPKFFSHRFIRVMGKACLANEIGPDGCWLLAYIANTEDAGGYRKPVTFWNGQLVPLLGLGSEASLKRLRQKCVDSGWLCYRQGAKGRAPSYYVTIPDVFADMDDGPTDEQEGEYQDDTFRPDSSAEMNQNPDGKRTESERKANGKRTESELHSSLTLSLKTEEERQPPEAAPVAPAPAPAVAAKPAAPKPPAYDPKAEALPFPSAAFRAAWGEWCDYRRESRRPLAARAVKQQLRDLAAVPEENALSAIRASIASQWQGLFPKATGPPRGKIGPETPSQAAARAAREMFDDLRPPPSETGSCPTPAIAG